MKHLLAILLLATSANAGQWLAYNAEGRTAAIPYVALGDVATVDLPTTAKRSSRAMSFFVEQTSEDLTGSVLSYTIELDASLSAVFPTYTYRGVTTPTSVRLWFTSGTAPYDFKHVNAVNQGTYWWSNPLDIDLEDLALFGGEVVLAETLTNPAKWSSALGKSGSAIPSEFYAAAANVRQVGFSFGGYFFDTGCKVGNGTATLHVRP